MRGECGLQKKRRPWSLSLSVIRFRILRSSLFGKGRSDRRCFPFVGEETGERGGYKFETLILKLGVGGWVIITTLNYYYVLQLIKYAM